MPPVTASGGLGLDKSLVLAQETEGSVRYQMLETVRAYAGERLAEAGEEQALRGRHTAWFLALSEEAEPKLTGAEPGTWLNVLETEHDNLRAALEESQSRPQGSEASLRLCGALWRFWETRGYLAEGREWCEAALGREQATDGTAASAKVWNGAGALAWLQGDYAAARAYYEQSLAIRREIGDRQGIALSLNGLGNVAMYQRDYAAARAYFEQSLGIQREIRDRRGMAASRLNLGNVAYDQGNYAAARAYYEQSLEIRREIGDRQGVAYSLEAFAALASSSGSTGALPAEKATAPENALFDLQRAPRLWGAAQALREQIGAPLPQKNQEEQTERIAKVRVKLSETEWTAAWEEGMQMTTEQAVAYALEETKEKQRA